MTNNEVKLDLSATELLDRLLCLPKEFDLSLLDSCGRDSGGSRYLIAAVKPSEKHEICVRTSAEACDALHLLDEKFSIFRKTAKNSHAVCFLTISYELGALLEKISVSLPQEKTPSLSAYFYETFVVYDYAARTLSVKGKNADETAKIIMTAKVSDLLNSSRKMEFPIQIYSNFSRRAYISAVEKIREYIRAGTIYQANLTQKISALFSRKPSAERVFRHLRENHPAPFAAFLRRKTQTVVSASPERFLKVENLYSATPKIFAAPIKGTRRRGATLAEDDFLRRELEQSIKDRAENVMIVDLLRNDLGRICRYGTVRVEKLCELETHETLFHLVSTIHGILRENTSFSALIRAAFPCGSITGAPKIRSMQILADIEKTPRNLSMGAIGCALFSPDEMHIDLNVAIRTLTFEENTATFNVGGGITIDSQGADEYDESMLKAKALINALQS